MWILDLSNLRSNEVDVDFAEAVARFNVELARGITSSRPLDNRLAMETTWLVKLKEKLCLEA